MTALAAPAAGRTPWAVPGRAAGVVAASVLGLAVVVAALPWLGGDPARTVFRARFGERQPDPAALASIRAELDLPSDPVTGALGWLGRALTGDLGRSWVSRGDVGAGVLPALGISLTLAGAAVVVALLVAVVVLGPALWRATRTGGPLGRSPGAASALLGSLPEPALALALVAVVAVGWGVLPTSGLAGPDALVLPALALGVPAGGLLARVLSGGVSSTLAESWIRSWRSVGAGRATVALAVARRAVAVAVPQVALLLVGLLGTAVTVERAFAVPGLGSTALAGVLARDVPVVQACVALLVLVALGIGAAAALAHRALLGPALSAADLPVAVPEPARDPRWLRAAPGVLGVLGVLVVVVGLFRDPDRDDLTARLAPPSARHPLGADALGRDLLARVAHGALPTVGVAVLVTAVSLALGLAVGLASRSGGAGFADVLNALPPVLVGVLLAAVTGPGLLPAAVAVAAVGWIPLAVHTRALAVEARASGYVRAAVLSGASPRRVARRHVLPAVVGPVVRHAAVRVPHAALGLAALSFLGLGAPEGSPEWGAMLADSLDYLVRAPWTILAPAGALALLGLVIGLMRAEVGPRRT